MSGSPVEAKVSIQGRLAVLVVERDGDWSGWVDALRSEADDLVVITQRRGESIAELATRVRERVQELRGTAELTAAALVGAGWDTETLSARALMVRAIASQMGAAAGGRIYLDGGPRSGRGRHAMAALAAVVEDQVAPTVDIVPSSAPVPAHAEPQRCAA